MKNNIKGITLVALVITIIILLILAGISIQSLTNTGLFENAKEAKKQSEISNVKEQIQLEIYAKQSENTGEITEYDLKSILENYGTVNYEEDSSKTEGIVLKQNVESGKKVDEGTTVTITVNKAESKSGTVTVNVKSITGGYDSSDTDLTDTDKKAKIDIKVDGTSVYTQSNVDKNSTAISTSFSGKGKVQIVVNIQDGNGASYTRTTELDLSKQTTYTAQ